MFFGDTENWTDGGCQLTDPLSPGEDDVLLQQVGVVQVFEDDGDALQQLHLVELHHALEASQQILLGFLVVVTELGYECE